jgi:hypothetical protein
MEKRFFTANELRTVSNGLNSAYKVIVPKIHSLYRNENANDETTILNKQLIDGMRELDVLNEYLKITKSSDFGGQ